MCLALHAARGDSPIVVISVPATSIVPAVGLSMPAIRFNNVVFPDPDGPISPRKSPSAISNEISRRTGISSESRQYDLESFRIETIAMARYLLLYFHLRSGLHILCRLQNHAVAGRKPAADFAKSSDRIPELDTNGARLVAA